MNKDLRYEFYIGDWLVEPARGRLSQGEKQVSLRPKVMDLLVYLSQKKGIVVSHDDLMETVWGGTIVTDSSIYYCVNLLREALGDDKNQPEYIETISKRGYRLIAAVEKKPNDERTEHGLADTLQERVDDIPTHQSPRFKFLSVIAIIASILVGAYVHSISPLTTSTPPAKPSIAVLAFSDFSPDGDQEYFADGISDEIINLLAKTDTMQVTGSTSSFSFKGKDDTIPEMAKKLGVKHILEGSIRKSGDTIRITVQLLDATSDEHLWSETYDRNLSDILVLQNDVAVAVVEALQITLNIEETNHKQDSKSIDPVTYDHYLKGKRAFRLHSVDSLFAAIEHFKAAIEVAPDFLSARIALAQTYQRQIAEVTHRQDREILDEAVSLLKGVLSADPKSSEAYYVLALVYSTKRETIEAKESIKEAYRLNSNNAHIITKYVLILKDEIEETEARALFTKAQVIDPLNAGIVGDFARYLRTYLHSYSEAEAAYKKAINLNPQHSYLAVTLASTYAEDLGDVSLAIKYMKIGFRGDPKDPDMPNMLSTYYFLLGDYTRALDYTNYVLELYPNDARAAEKKAEALISLGRDSEALQLIRKTLENPNSVYRLTARSGFIEKAVAIYFRRGDVDAAETFFNTYDSKTTSLADADLLATVQTYWGLKNIITLSKIYTAHGQTGKARRLTDKLNLIDEAYFFQLQPHIPRLSGRQYYSLAMVSDAQGRPEEAIDYLEKMIENGLLSWWRAMLLQEMSFMSLKGHPRFIALIERIEAEMARQRTIVEAREVNE